jgi:hypothetical protein
MSQKRKVKMAIDLVMTILLPILMAYSLIGETIHEWLGILMFLLFFLHHLLNWRWHKTLIKGHYSALRIFGTAINLILVIIMIVLPVSGIIMAKHTFRFLNLTVGISFARVVHMMASYWGFVLMSVHLGLHWNMIMNMVRKAMNVAKTLVWRMVLLRIVVILIVGYGIYSFFTRQFTDYMFLRSQFVFIDFSEFLLFFFIDYLAIMGLFVSFGYYFGKLLGRMTTAKR